MSRRTTEGKSNGAAEPLRLLVMDKVAVIGDNRDRYRRLISQANVRMTLLAPSLWPENSRRTNYEHVDGEPFETVLGRTSWPGRESKSIYYNGIVKAFRRSRPDVILLMEEPFSLFALQAIMLRKLFAPKAPVIFYTCYIIPYAEQPYRPRWFFRNLAYWMFKRTAVGLCINDKATRMLTEAGFPGARTLFFGIDERLFQPIGRDAARCQLNVPADEEIFMYAGRLLELKGIQDLIEAFARIRAERSDRKLRLWVVGAGPYDAELKAKAESLGVSDLVEFHPAIPIARMPLYMSAANALVLPSRHEWFEQFGRVLAEAMMLETPVIGSTSGEIPRVIGEEGYVFKAGDIDGLKAAMERVLDDPEETARRVAAARPRALREYSTAAFVRGLIDVIDEVSEGRLERRGES